MKGSKKFKKAIGLIHLWLGLFSGLIVVIISITGCLYVFETDIRAYLQKEYAHVPLLPDQQAASLKTLVQQMDKITPGQKITAIEVNHKQPNATVAFSVGKDAVYYLNPYNGNLVKKTSPDYLLTVREIHTSLLMGDTGKFIIRWSVVIFIILLASGLILWFPGQLRLLKQVLTIKWDSSIKRINYDLHHVLGFYASGILLVISLSGLYFGFKEVRTAVSFLSGSKLSEGKKASAPKQAASPVQIPDFYGNIYAAGMQQYPGAELTTLTVRKEGQIRLRLNYPSDWERKRNTFFYDAENGQLIRSKLYHDYNRADIIEAANYDLHTGQIFGLFGKIAATLISLISASLPITGFIIWLKRGKKKKKKAKKLAKPSLAIT